MELPANHQQRRPKTPHRPVPPQAHTQAETPTPADHAAIVARVQAQAYEELVATDQLRRELAAGRVLVGFQEAPIAFPPTFKVQKGAPGLVYGTKRSPAYCDRVLWRSNLPQRAASAQAYYCCPDIATSDHKPVAAVLTMPLGEAYERVPVSQATMGAACVRMQALCGRLAAGGHASKQSGACSRLSARAMLHAQPAGSPARARSHRPVAVP